MELIWNHVKDQLSRSRVKFCIDEDISQKVAETLRKRGVDAVSAHDIGKEGASDEDQFAEAVSKK